MKVKEQASALKISNSEKEQKNIRATIENQIAFMVRFYPSPKFMEMDFDQTQASSSNKTSRSAEFQAEPQSLQSQSQHMHSRSRNSVNPSSQELSEIKVRNFGFALNSFKPKQKDSNSLNESELDCRSLLDELSFRSNPSKSFCLHYQSNKKIKDPQLENKDKSFLCSEIPNFTPNLQEINAQQKIPIQSNINQTENYQDIPKYRWDPPSQLIFQKDLKIKRLVNLVTTHHFKNLQTSFQKIKFKSYSLICQKCNNVFQEYRKQIICRKCLLKTTQSYKFESRPIIPFFIRSDKIFISN